MALDPVPWMVTGGEHSAEVGRMLAYIACGGSEGVVATGDFKVRASDVPDGNIHVQPGAVAVLNRFPGGGQQAYVIRNASDTVVATSPQGSSGVRYDLVCVIVEDPEYPGQPDPVDIASGPYVRVVIYTDVAEGTRQLAEIDPDQSGYALALVKFDISDGTVTSADITDLRELLNPKSSIATDYEALTYSDASCDAIALNDPVPVAGVIDIDIPTWCNRIQFTIVVTNLVLGDIDTASVTPAGVGGLTANLGALASSEAPLLVAPGNITDTGSYGHSLPSPFVDNALIAVFGSAIGNTISAVTFTWNLDVPLDIRGTTQQFSVKLSSRSGMGAGQEFWVVPEAYTDVSAVFQQSMDSVY